MKLEKYLLMKKKRVSDFAREIGVIHCVALRWVRGKAIPRKRYMQKIMQMTCGKVNPIDFYEQGKETGKQ